MHDGGLHAAVDHFAGDGAVTIERAEVDHAAFVARRQAGHHGAAHQHRADEIAVDDSLRVGKADIERAVGIGFAAGGTDITACAVDQNGNRPQRLFGGGHHGSDLRFIGNVAQNGGRAHAKLRRQPLG